MKKKEKESKNRKSFAIIWEISLERKGLHGLFFRASYKSVRAMNVECSPTVSKISNSFVLRRQQKNIIQGSFNIEVIATRNISNRGSKVSRVIIYSPFIIGGNGAEKSLFHHVCILKRSSSRYGGYFHLRNNLKKIFTFFFFFLKWKKQEEEHSFLRCVLKWSESLRGIISPWKNIEHSSSAVISLEMKAICLEKKRCFHVTYISNNTRQTPILKSCRGRMFSNCLRNFRSMSPFERRERFKKKEREKNENLKATNFGSLFVRSTQWR